MGQWIISFANQNNSLHGFKQVQLDSWHIFLKENTKFLNRSRTNRSLNTETACLRITHSMLFEIIQNKFVYFLVKNVVSQSFPNDSTNYQKFSTFANNPINLEWSLNNTPKLPIAYTRAECIARGEKVGGVGGIIFPKFRGFCHISSEIAFTTKIVRSSQNYKELL